MATLSFEGETHGELVIKVRRWLASVEGEDAGHLGTTDAIEQGAELTKEALRIIAAAAPEPIAQHEVVKALTGLGYKATDATKEAIIDGLDSVEEVTGGSVVKRARDVAEQAVYEMNAQVARQILKSLRPPLMPDVEIGMGKDARPAYGLDEVSIVPSRRTRDLDDVDTTWEIDAFGFDVPIMASGMDSVVSPTTAVALGELGSVGPLNLEGLWTRHDDPESLLRRIATLPEDEAGAEMRQAYAAPVRPELIRDRVKEIRASGVVSCGAVTPHRVEALADAIVAAELDLLVIQGTVVSAEHVTRGDPDPLNLKTFVRRLDLPVIVGGCSSYRAALHLMRTGAAGILVGVGEGSSSSTRRILGLGVPQATAIADARAARMRHLDETGVYVHLVADGGIRTGGDIAKAIVCGADAVMVGAPFAAATEAPGRGWHWGQAAVHADLPRGRTRVDRVGTLAEVLHGPATDDSGATNIVGALRRTMALTGYASAKELQKAELVVHPVASR